MDLIAILFGSSIIGFIGVWSKWVISIFAPLVLLLIYHGVRIQAKTYGDSIPKTLNTKIYGCLIRKDNEPSSYFWGKWFIGSIQGGEDQGGTIYMICTTAMFDSLMINKRDEDEDCDKFDMKSLRVDNGKFSTVTVSGSYHQRRIDEVSTDPIDADPRCPQKKIIDTIFNLRKRTQVVMITGNPGSGKSFIADLFIKAALLKPTGCFEGCTEVRYCYNFNPSEPNTFFTNVYRRVSPTKTKRLIVLLDEIDVLLDSIHRNDLPPNPKFPREVSDKTSWNRFMDNFDRGYYPWVTVIMTSNRTRAQLDAMDKSFLREGRVDQWYKL
jgi:hypothetical protein